MTLCKKLLIIFIYIVSFKNVVATCSSSYEMPKYCKSHTSSCASQLSDFPDTECMIEAPGACPFWIFDSVYSTNPSSVRLLADRQCFNSVGYTIPKLLLTDIKWTTFKFRFTEQDNKKRTFCRKIRMSSKNIIPSLHYDCRWTIHRDFSKLFIFEYEAEMESQKESGKYHFILPRYGDIDFKENESLQHWSPFLYIDVTKTPLLNVRWQPAPAFGGQTYELKVYDRDELRRTEIITGTGEEELSYDFGENFPKYGEFKVEVRLKSNYCENSLCSASVSPVIITGTYRGDAFIIVVTGCTVILVIMLVITFTWLRCKEQEIPKPPKLLIIYTESHEAHNNVMKELRKYLRKKCFVDASLDKLHIRYSETQNFFQNPYVWCKDAFTDLDFAMVVSSPPSYCRQDGLYRDVDTMALRFLQNDFSNCNPKCRSFSVILPYCSAQDLPSEAKHFPKFWFPKDFDKMLWFIHGKFPRCFNSLCLSFLPKFKGGSSDLDVEGTELLNAIMQAGSNVRRNCNCVSTEQGVRGKNSYMTIIEPRKDLQEQELESQGITCDCVSTERRVRGRNVGDRSTDMTIIVEPRKVLQEQELESEDITYDCVSTERRVRGRNVRGRNVRGRNVGNRSTDMTIIIEPRKDLQEQELESQGITNTIAENTITENNGFITEGINLNELDLSGTENFPPSRANTRIVEGLSLDDLNLSGTGNTVSQPVNSRQNPILMVIDLNEIL